MSREESREIEVRRGLRGERCDGKERCKGKERWEGKESCDGKENWERRRAVREGEV